MKQVFLAILLAAAASMGVAATSKGAPATPSMSCPCSGTKYCVGPRGGRYCITSGGKKRYARR